MLPYLLKKRRTAVAFSPSDVTGLQLWMRADTGVNVSADSDPVTNWISKEGNSYTFTQGEAAKRPLLRTGANGINSQPAIQFDGGDDGLRVANGAVLTGSVGTVAAVVETGTVQDEMTILGTSDEVTTSKNIYFQAYRSAAQPNITINHNGTGAADTIRGSTAIGSTETRLAVFISTDTAYVLRVDGAGETEAVVVGGDSGDWFDEAPDKDNTTIGFLNRTDESRFFIGKIAEILVYDTELTGDDLSNVESYLAGRYGITLP